MTRFNVVLAGTAAALALACSTTPGTADGDFRMGLLVPGSVAEEGWNRIAYDALKRVEAELGAEVSYVELHENPATFETAFRNYARQGYDVVLGHGFQFEDAALTVAPDFPETTFLISSSQLFEDNVVGLDTDSSQPFYLMGVLAAMTGDAAGLVGGMEIPPIHDAFEGFRNGATSVAPEFQVSEIYIGSFTDSSSAKEAALSLVARGADFVVPNANAAGLGVIQAAKEAGVGTFSVYSDHRAVAPKNILGVYVADYAQGIVRIASQVEEGSFAPEGNIVFGLADEDVMHFSFNEDAGVLVSDEVRAAVDAARAKIVAGEIRTRSR
jgi:simple sugar transport system substrate-binding protein